MTFGGCRFAVLFACCALLAGPAGAAGAAGRRALVIGIDTYAGKAPPAAGGTARVWKNLGGAVADARAVEAFLISRLGFEPRAITFLSNAEASRARLLAELQKLAAAGQGPDDVLFLYYAGHGSQVPNSLSPERDKLDETLVPADAVAGAADVTDKELGLALEPAARRGAKVTVVLDSCHSGSATRGASVMRLRQLAPLTVDRPDGRVAHLVEAGALTLSAAQDYQPAAEAADEGGKSHGVFTASLLRALSALPPSASAEALFLATREDLRTRGFAQEPVLEGSLERRRLPLLGERLRGGSARPLAAVANVDLANGEVTLRTGIVTGVGPGSILARAGAPAGSRPRLVVKEADFSTSVAVPELETDSLEGIDATTPFELVLVSPPREAALRIAVPPAPLSRERVLAVARALAPLRTDASLVRVEDPAAVVPTHTVLHDGKQWVLVGPDGKAAPLGESPSAAAVKAAVLAAPRADPPRAAPCDTRPCLGVRLPPTPELVAALPMGALPEDAIQRVAEDASADYAIYGRLAGDGVEYALVRLVTPPVRCRAAAGGALALEEGLRDPRASCEAAKGRWLSDSAPEPSTLPARTDFHRLEADPRATAAELARAATQIARVSALLRLKGPGGDERWPYRLAIRREGASTVEEGALTKGRYRLVLKGEGDLSSPERRRVYVLVLQSDGAISLLYPSSNVENLFPPAHEEPGPEYVLDVPIDVGPPYGVDTLLLVTSREVVPGLEALEAGPVLDTQRGGRTRGGPRSSALADLLVDTAARTRGDRAPYPTEWSVEQRRFVTVPQGAGGAEGGR